MNRISFYLIFIILLIISSCSSRTGMDVLKNTQEALTEIKTVEYEVSLKAGSSANNFKAYINGIAFFDFTSTDTILGNRYHFKFDGGTVIPKSENVFNGSDLLSINWKDSTLMALVSNKVDMKKTASAGMFMICSYPFLNNIIPILFEKNLINNESCLLSDTIIGSEYYKLNIKLNGYKFIYTTLTPTKDSSEVTNLEIVIDKKDYLPKMIHTSDSKNTYFFTSYFSNVKFNVTRNDSVWDLNSYPMELKRIDPFNLNQSLKVGTNAPLWKLPTLDKDSLCSTNLNRELILYNFWSTNCGGCIRALPGLNTLHQKYSKFGFNIVGIVSKEKETKRINEIVKRFDIKYPIVWKAEKVEKLYNVWAHPTFYLLNSKGEVLYSQIGFTEEIEENIKCNLKL